MCPAEGLIVLVRRSDPAYEKVVGPAKLEITTALVRLEREHGRAPVFVDESPGRILAAGPEVPDAGQLGACRAAARRPRPAERIRMRNDPLRRGVHDAAGQPYGDGVWLERFFYRSPGLDDRMAGAVALDGALAIERPARTLRGLDRL